MHPLDDNTAFWASNAAHLAVNRYRPHDADGVAEFIAGDEATRSLLFFPTSGSEGLPKWVGLSRRAFLHSARMVNEHLEVTSRDRWLIALPLYHVGGFSIFARCHESGASFYCMDGDWDAHRFIECCRRERPTLTSLVPTQVFDIVRAGFEAPPGLRAVVVGGGAIQVEKIRWRAIELGWPLLQSYGMTEACSQIATEPLAHLHAGHDPDRLEVLPGWNLETDREGVLRVRGPSLATGYATSHEAPKRDWRKRAWCSEEEKLAPLHASSDRSLWSWTPINPEEGLVTRDSVQLWMHGSRQFLRFIGRGSSFVKILGELVNVSVLQARLEALLVTNGLRVETAVIFVAPDDRKGCRLVLVGEGKVAAMEKVRTSFNERVTGVERLDEVKVVEALPRTALGKIDGPALNRLMEEAGG